ncbi:MAG: MarR family transcriptional regulator [Dehalococcoidia bacterium]|nr:MarR family transcriptional regulator [Dehalococcoidia bacterium]
MTLSQVRMLLYLFQNGPLTMGELAHGLGVSCSAVTECVDSLEERRAAIRHRSETDRRLVLVSMTPEVEAVAVQVLGQWKAVLHHALVQLSPEEGQAFVKGARLLAQAAESWMERNLSFEHDLSRASVPSSVDSSANVAARV